MAFNQRTPKGEYHIAFDTRMTPGYITAVKVTIEVDQLPDDSGMPGEMQTKYAINLVDHPAYKDLEAYVLANRGKGKKR